MAALRASSVWERIDKVNGGERVRCRLCEKKLKYNGSTTSNLREHLVRLHPSAPAVASAEESKDSMKKGVLTMKKFLGKECISKKEKLMITDRIVDWLTGSLRPVSLVTDDGLVQLLHILKPGYKIPSRPNANNS